MRPLAAALLLLLSACATAPAVVLPRTEGEKLRAAVEQWFEEELRLNPVSATYLGDHRYDDQFGNPASLEHERGVSRACEDGLARVRAVDPAGLSAADQVTRETFIHDCTTRLVSLRHPGRLLPLNQMGNPVLTLAMLGSGEGPQPLEDRQGHEAWLRRAAGVVPWVDSAIAAMREGQAVGITRPRVVLQRVVKQLDGLLEGPLEQSLFLRPLEKVPAGLERERLATAYRETFGQEVLPAIARLRDFVRDEHLPRARESAGWSALPGGAGWYAAAVAASTTTSELSPADIHALGLKEVARIRAEMEQVKAQVGFPGDLQAFFAHVRTDPRYFFDSPEALLAAHRALKQRIDAALPRLFTRFPRADYEVRPVEAFRAASAAGGEYQAPAADGSRPGIFYVNTHDLKAQPRYGLETLSLHEAAPGHHFQIALQQELDLPRFRRFGGYTAFSEGWALYAESLGKELGLFQQPMDYYGRLNDEQLRAMRLVVDTGLHALGWSREQAIRYMLDNSSLAESDATAEVERYMVWPGQALGYKVGQLRMTALRARLQERLGARFDVKAFHAVMLEDGQLPLAVLERKLERWADLQDRAR